MSYARARSGIYRERDAVYSLRDGAHSPAAIPNPQNLTIGADQVRRIVFVMLLGVPPHLLAANG